MTELVKARAAIDINTFMLSGASKVRPYRRLLSVTKCITKSIIFII